MGGKHKQAQRTKNNARPSSSGRSAALLANSTPNFASFNAVKECGYVPSLHGFAVSSPEDIDSNIDVNFQLVLKKMNKKDSTTRLKALQEFAQLVAAEDAGETVKAVLPCWARLFCQLSLDPEHRVREAAHLAQRAVVHAARRNLAPHLRQLVGPWFTAQYDTHPPAASAATLALQDAFPPKKMIEAIIFCQQEILNYIIDNVTVQTAQTLSNPKTTSAEDMESKYQRVLVSSLQGYALFLQKLPPEHLEAVKELNNKLISSKRYWKLASYKAPLVRNAWFSALIAVCQKAPYLLEDSGPQVAVAVFGNLDEADPVVLPLVWEAALHVLTTVQNCWSHVDSEKVVFPKLWSVLREGGQGNAVAIFPNLLPFLSKLPCSAYHDKEAFYGQFFTNLRQGFKQKSVQLSVSESNAVAKCYIECMRYLININQTDSKFCMVLEDSQLFPAIEMSLKDQFINCTSFFKEISNLLHYWSRNRNIGVHVKLLENFWKSMSEMSLRLLIPSHTDSLQPQELPPEWQLQRYLDLCTALRNPHHEIHKRKIKVKFAAETDEEMESKDSEENTMLKMQDEENGIEFGKEYSHLVRSLAVLFFKNLKIHKAIVYARPLKTLLDSAYDTKDLLNALAQTDGDGEDQQVQKFVNEIIYAWLQDKILCTEPIIELTFSLLLHLSHEEKLKAIHHLYKLSEFNRSVLLWLLKVCAKHVTDVDVAEFIQGADLSGKLLALAEEVCSCPEVDDENKIAIIRYCLTVPTLADSAIPSILRKLAQGLRQQPSPTSSCVLLACEAAGMVPEFGSSGADLAAGLLLAAVSCNDGDSHVAEAWQHCAPFLDVSVVPVLASELCNILHHCDTLRMTEELQPLNQEVKMQLLLRIKIALSEDSTWLAAVCHLGRQLRGQMAGDSLSQPTFPGPCHDLCCYAGLCLLSACLLQQLLSRECDSISNYDVLLNELVPDIAFFVATFNDFLACYSSTKHYNKIYAYVANLKTEFKKIVGILKKNEIEAISSNIVERARLNGGLWVWALYQLHKAAFSIEDGQAIYSFLIAGSTDTGLPRIHAEQVYFVLNDLNNSKIEFSNAEFTKTLPTITCWLNNVTGAFQNSGEIVVRHFLEEICSNYKVSKYNIHDCDIANSEWEEVNQAVERINFLAAAVENAWFTIPIEVWDYVLLVLTYFVKGLQNGLPTLLLDTSTQPLLSTSRCNHTFIGTATCRLFKAVDSFFAKCAHSNSEEFSKKIYKDLLEEWKLVYAEEIFQTYRNIFNFIADTTEEADITLDRHILLEEIGSSLLQVNLSQYLQFSNNDAAIDIFIQNCKKLIYSPACILQLTGYHVLQKLVPALCQKDAEASVTVGSLEHEQELETIGLLQLCALLKEGEEKCSQLLGSLRPGEALSPEPFSNDLAHCAAYLLIWALTLEMCAAASPQLRYQYAARLRGNNSLNHLLQNLFHLMPVEVLKITEVKAKPPKAYLFSMEPSFKFSEPFDKLYLQHLACWVYYSTLRRLPAMVRQWWGETEPRMSNVVDRVTTCYVSPLLCVQEMQAVQQQDVKYNNMQVKVHASVREVVAIYSMDEARVELVVKLPANYPLGLVKVESGQRFVGSNQWRNWMMQLTIFLTHQNGSLWDGLMLLKSNLDRRFEGVEECYICFSVLHGSNFQLPKLCCKTCKKKFHSPCLYKWFSTSNKSTCPICRNMF